MKKLINKIETSLDKIIRPQLLKIDEGKVMCIIYTALTFGLMGVAADYV